jgi:uncharacterized protein YraI
MTAKLKPELILLALVALIAPLLLVAPLATAQDATPIPTREPFSLQIDATPTVFGAAAPTQLLISLTGVSGMAERAPVAIRSGPGLNYPRISRLAQGRSIDITGWNGWQDERICTPDFANDLDMWVEVQFGERRGWIARCVLTIRGNVTGLPIVRATGERVLQR